MNQNAGGRCTTNESSYHINSLELLAAVFALQSFASHRKSICVKIKLDSSSGVAYINNREEINLTHLIPFLWRYEAGVLLGTFSFPQNTLLEFKVLV